MKAENTTSSTPLESSKEEGSRAVSSEGSAVTSHRKQELLLEARRSRVEWVDSSSCPTAAPELNINVHDVSIPKQSTIENENEDGMALIRHARSSLSIKSAVEVVQKLYGIEEEEGGGLTMQQAKERVAKQLSSQLSREDAKQVFSSSECVTTQQSLIENKIYDSFIQKLRSPESADLVQAMKHFTHSVQGMVTTSKVLSLVKDSSASELNADISDKQERLLRHIAKSIQTFLGNTKESMRSSSHPLWEKETDDEWTQSKTSLETFLFSKCYDLIWKVATMKGTDTCERESLIQDRIKSLQFVTPRHLEIQCVIKMEKKNLSSDSNDNGETEVDLREILEVPIKTLQSLSSRFSPTDKLKCIHDAYKRIVTDLSSLSPTSSPSADDILPAFIFTLIQARPQQIIPNLFFIECLATPEQLQGEVGYSFTSLYGAAHFLIELNMDNNSNEAGAITLAISNEEWQKGLLECQPKIATTDADDALQGATNAKNSNSCLNNRNADDIFPSASEMRAARLKGDIINMEWVEKWQKDQHERNLPSEGKEDQPEDSTPGGEESNQYVSSLPSYPNGFNRSYSFLGKKPQDIRIGDIPQLLSEYHQLVNACESMLSERSTLQKDQQKLKVWMERKKLAAAASDDNITEQV